MCTKCHHSGIHFFHEQQTLPRWATDARKQCGKHVLECFIFLFRAHAASPAQKRHTRGSKDSSNHLCLRCRIDVPCEMSRTLSAIPPPLVFSPCYKNLRVVVLGINTWAHRLHVRGSATCSVVGGIEETEADINRAHPGRDRSRAGLHVGRMYVFSG